MTREAPEQASDVFKAQVRLLEDRLSEGDTLPRPITIAASDAFERVHANALKQFHDNPKLATWVFDCEAHKAAKRILTEAILAYTQRNN